MCNLSSSLNDSINNLRQFNKIASVQAEHKNNMIRIEELGLLSLQNKAKGIPFVIPDNTNFFVKQSYEYKNTADLNRSHDLSGSLNCKKNNKRSVYYNQPLPKYNT